ncbi:Gfo/Idh/MocA family oxidoreductase [Paracoccus liaowanqingii]|uniref:Gfo/Idh/MocA family oxidoreductase n=1 Tax=Paracoccus liaowanqingii TaxID=2560053 RepID=A0A4Z1BLZ4_9RHOB|nr:Gfo/Idh/MocA family oxidoreductase [Paracoccus liaowanqingii]TGN62099.1 Gfo/Idh/MocA family oxidoreductase [Paracoccus liaowanqingii]
MAPLGLRTITYGVIGCGMMGQEHLRNIALLPGTAIGAIFEPDPAMRARAATLAPRARLVDSIDALLADPDLDCLLIASPNFRHVEQLQAIAARRPLPVLVEKPLFTDPRDLAAVQAFADRYPAPVWVAMEYRYMPPVARLLAMAPEATGGIRMLSIREHRYPFLSKVDHWNRFNRYTGGTFVEKCCHFFDLMRLAIGADPVRIMATGGQALNHLDEDHGGRTPDIFDHGYVAVEFEGGVRAMLELCMFAEGSRWQEEISAVGPRGKIEAFVPGPTRFWPDDLGAAPVAQVVVSPRDPKGPQVHAIPVDPALLEAGDHNGSTFYQHQRFLDLVRGQRRTPEVTLQDGIWAVRMGQAAQAAMSEGRVITL